MGEYLYTLFYWPAFIGVTSALALTVLLVTLFLVFKDQASRIASLIILSAMISLGAAYFAYISNQHQQSAYSCGSLRSISGWIIITGLAFFDT
jgi:hypothetical protein